ncbi:MAG: S-layer homology domain-containing protein [bacterium]
MKKIVISLLLISVLIFTGCPFKKKDKYISQFHYLTANVSDLRSIAEEDAITRKDAAYLFSIYFPITVKIDAQEIPFDIKMYPYPSLILSAVKRQMMSLYPDGTFKPDEIVSRYQLAILLTKYILTIDPFFDANFRDIELKDVNETFFAYKPIAMMISSGIMETANDSFYPNGIVSGYDAIRFFHRIREFYR